MKIYRPYPAFLLRRKISSLPRKGFTLVELLVVIVIIATLAVLSFSVFSKMRSNARSATCSSNLRQIGTAMHAYASDNNGQLPPLEDRTAEGDKLLGIWTKTVSDGGYLERVRNKNGVLGTGAGVWACPECTTVNRNYNGYGVAEGTVLKVKKASLPGSGSLRFAKIEDPARTWLVGDATNSGSNVKSGWYAIWAKPSRWSNHAPAARHGSKVNVCMVDGHIESLTISQLTDGNYTLHR